MILRAADSANKLAVPGSRSFAGLCSLASRSLAMMSSISAMPIFPGYATFRVGTTLVASNSSSVCGTPSRVICLCVSRQRL
jgi:hypothetical protein